MICSNIASCGCIIDFVDTIGKSSIWDINPVNNRWGATREGPINGIQIDGIQSFIFIFFL